MHEANRIVRRVIGELGRRIRPGITTAQIDAYAEQRIREAGAEPAFKGYPHRGDGRDFPGTVCTSVNDEVVHGVPSERVVLNEGDIVSVDLGVRYKGYYGDSAETFAVGRISDEAARLLRVTREALDVGVAQARSGNRVSDIGHAVQQHVERHGFSVVREFVGHGIGAQLHEDPQIPNYGEPGRRERLVPGMVLAIEPMVNAGSPEVVLSAQDGWTARTRDPYTFVHVRVYWEDGRPVFPVWCGGPTAVRLVRASRSGYVPEAGSNGTGRCRTAPSPLGRHSRWMVTALPAVGQLVYSRAGRDRNRPFVVVGVCDDRHVLVVDGEIRPSARPKRKNVRHLSLGLARYPDIGAGRIPSDAALRQWLRKVTAGATVPSSGSEEELT